MLVILVLRCQNVNGIVKRTVWIQTASEPKHLIQWIRHFWLGLLGLIILLDNSRWCNQCWNIEQLDTCIPVPRRSKTVNLYKFWNLYLKDKYSELFCLYICCRGSTEVELWSLGFKPLTPVSCSSVYLVRIEKDKCSYFSRRLLLSADNLVKLPGKK